MTKITYKKRKDEDFSMRTTKAAPMDRYEKLLEFVKTLLVHCSGEFCRPDEFIRGYEQKNNEIEARAIKILQEIGEYE